MAVADAMMRCDSALPRAEVLACAKQVIKEATLQLLSKAAK